MSKLEDLFETIAIHTKYNHLFLRGIYQAMQQREAEKTPDGWRAYYAVVGAPQTRQIIRHDRRRGSFTIYNAGPSAVLIGDRDFDGPAAVTLYNANSPQSVGDFMPVLSGQSTTVPASGALYAYAVNTGGANPNAALSIVETLFNVYSSNPHTHKLRPGAMASMERGIPVDEDNALLVAPPV